MYILTSGPRGTRNGGRTPAHAGSTSNSSEVSMETNHGGHRSHTYPSPDLDDEDLPRSCRHRLDTVVLVAHEDSRITALEGMLEQLPARLERAASSTVSP